MALGETDVADGYPKTMNRGPGVPASASCSYSSSSSITELLGALCDTFVSGVSWTLPALRSGSGSGSVERFRRDLRRRAYGVLLSTLFQDGSPKGLPGPLASTPPRNKVLMLSFNLRVSGRQEEAERLEELLGALGDGRGSGLAELNSVLELLVQLAGSVPPPPTSFSRDYGRWERPVTRRPPVGSYLSAELLRLEARTWALVTAEESGAMGCLGGSLGLMDAPPGSGLLFLGRRGDAEERFEKETRTSLFGALQHSRTSDLDVRLDLPPVPSNADVAGLALRVPPALDQSEDEGFRSDSNPTPDSQSAPSPGPDLDVWEALHDFQPSHRRCWEMVGCPPGSKEKPFLTEGGRQAFDQLYRLVERNVRTLSSGPASPPIPPPRDSESLLVGDLLNVLMGVPSATFPLNPTCAQFEVRPGVCISGASPESLSRLLGDLAQYGTHYLRLSRFSLQGAQRRGLVFQAFTGGLMRYLQYYCACVLSTPNTLSLLTICFQFRKLGSQLRYLSELCCLDGASPAAGQATFPVGVKLLSYLYSEAQSNCSNENYPVLLSLLKSSCDPYTRFVSDWVYSGVFRDVYGEFMIQVNEDHLGCRDKHFWSEGYTLISRSVEENVPVFLRHLANDVYVCGKTINLLKICCPQHYICRSELPVPRIAVTVSLRELEEVERDCAVYRSRMGQVARHSVVTREEQAQRMERARQELISQVRASTAKTLESIRGLQVSQRLAEGARKRERFVELKQQLEMEQERRGTAQRKEQEDEFGFLRELQDRERRLQALQEAQERRARKELIDQYSQLTEEAAKRERRALWRVQRMRLHQDRVRLLQEDRRLIQALLEQYPLGQPGPPTVPQTSARTQRPSQASGEVVQDTPTGPQETPTGPQDTPTGPQETPTGLQAPPSPAEEEALISDELDIRDFLPKPGPAPDEQEVDRALQDIGSDLPQVPALAQDYDFSAPYVPLQGSPTLPHSTPAAPPLAPVWAGDQPPPEGAALPEAKTIGRQPGKALPSHTPTTQVNFAPGGVNPVPDPSGPVAPITDTHIRVGEHVSKVTTPVPAPSVHGHASDAHIRVGEHVSEVMTPVPAPSVHGHASDAHIRVGEHVSEVTTPVPAPSVHGHASDAHIRVGEHVSEVTTPVPAPSVHGHTSDAHIRVGEHVSEVTTPVPAPSVHGHTSDAHIRVGEHVSEVITHVPAPNVHGHASDAHIRVGEHVSEVITHVPAPNVHGHASDAHIRVGEHVSEVITHVPAPNVHGHASDAHIRVGEHVSEVITHVPAPNVHGHASDAHIRVGEHVSEVITHVPAPNVHGHASDAHIRVGEHVSEVMTPVPAPSIHGHASDSSIKVGGFVSDVTPSRPRWSKHGHSSDSVLRVGCAVSGVEPLPLPLPGSDYGHSSDSALRAGCVVSGVEPLPVPLPGSDYGHSSDSALRAGCVVSGVEPLPVPLPGSDYGHSSDSALGAGCVVTGSRELRGAGPEAGPEAGAHVEPEWPVEGAEQDYLASLASQYEVERYQDPYALLALAPGSQTLQQVVRGPYRPPGVLSLDKAADGPAVELSEMVPLPVLMKLSVTTPLITHVSLVNKAVVDYFFVELGVERHFEALRHFLLMEDGEFAQSLSDLLFEKLRSGPTPGELLTPLVLNSILSKALQYSLHGDIALASSFSFALRFVPETFHPLAPDALNCLELRYKVDWPLNIIITDSCMNKYNRLFSFLLQLKHMVWTLRDVWFHLKALVKGAGSSVQFRQLQLYRHEMQHFVKVIQGYIADQILQVSWNEFTHKLGNVHDLDAIHHTHADYLNRAIFRGLLTDKAAPVMNIIHSIFSLILKFRAQLIAQPWSRQQGELVHPSFVALQQFYNTFKYYSHFLFKVVTKLVDRGYQPHLEDFLLRINFNNYYKET
ncbi:gamma-tubulin complex component 6 isoform X2 [Conger conger]|uniref:gamma-tubulin complex component 6 isoform X2 n=1 Tax=Conger conger TaxID=82655 RepID=UPI002A59DC60|nr:gamma-tubulin complex component 6 isoform X2 [Conger conger]